METHKLRQAYEQEHQIKAQEIIVTLQKTAGISW